MPDTDEHKPLAGVRVVEITHFEVGTMCGQMLAWLGADVIKVEPPGIGDPSRGQSEQMFAALNTSKRAITLDLKSAAGVGIMTRLLDNADVLVENLAPGTLARLGFGSDTLRKINPSLIVARAKGFGNDGPYAEFKSYDMIAQATGGMMFTTRDSGSGPIRTRYPLADNATGVHLALGILAALRSRDATGEATDVEVSMQDCVVSMGRTWLALNSTIAEVHAGAQPSPPGRIRTGNKMSAVAGNLYSCAPGGPDDLVYIYCHGDNPRHWYSLFSTIRCDELVLDPNVYDPAWRAANADALEQRISAWTGGRDKHEVMRLLGGAGVPCGAVLTGEEVVRDRHLVEREMFVGFQHGDGSRVATVASPIRFSGWRTDIRCPPLRLGEHNKQVYAELGVTEDELESLRTDGVV